MSVIVYVLAMLITLIPQGRGHAQVTVIPPMPQHKPDTMRNAQRMWRDMQEAAYWAEVDRLIAEEEAKPVSIAELTGEDEECLCDECCWMESYLQHVEEFNALFNSYTYKLSKNGRSMINGKFVAMAKKG